MVEWINYIDLEVSFEEIEKKIGTGLPSDFKEILKKYNKGMPKPNKFSIADGKLVEFSQLLSFNTDEKLTAYSCMTSEMKEQKIIPFAVTKNNNFLCLKSNNIILYNIEHNAEKFVCDTFTELLSKLK